MLFAWSILSLLLLIAIVVLIVWLLRRYNKRSSTILPIVFFCMLLAHGEKSEAQTMTTLDTTKYAVLSYHKYQHSYLFDFDVKPTTLSSAEVSMVIKLVKKRTKQFNQDKPPYQKSINYPGTYCSQFIAVTNSQCQKLVYVNCFCNTFITDDSWKKELKMRFDQ